MQAAFIIIAGTGILVMYSAYKGHDISTFISGVKSDITGNKASTTNSTGSPTNGAGGTGTNTTGPTVLA